MVIGTGQQDQACDFFLWGYLKSLYYTNNALTIQDLKEEIIHVNNGIQPKVCEKIERKLCEESQRACHQAAGGHLLDIKYSTKRRHSTVRFMFLL